MGGGRVGGGVEKGRGLTDESLLHKNIGWGGGAEKESGGGERGEVEGSD